MLLPQLGSKPQFLGRLARSAVTILTTIQRQVVCMVTTVFGSASELTTIQRQVVCMVITVFGSASELTTIQRQVVCIETTVFGSANERGLMFPQTDA
jgi:hypothetical protein